MAKNKTLVSFGELLLRLSTPNRDLLLQTPSFDACVGGAEANVAVSLSHFGHTARMVSLVPDSRLGEAVVSELRRHGVDVSGVGRRPGRLGQYFLEAGAMLRRSEIIYDRQGSVFALAKAADYDWKTLLRGADWLHLSGVTPALGQHPANAALAAAEAARQRGVKVSFDGNYREQLWALRGHRGKSVLRDILACASIAFINDRDLALILGEDFDGHDHEGRIRRAADRAFEEFPLLKRICCTRRDEDSYAGLMFTPKRTLRSRRYPIRMVVDRIGTGDAFAAGVLHGVMNNWSEQRAVEFGAAAGALKHCVRGDFNTLSEDQVVHVAEGGSAEIKR